MLKRGYYELARALAHVQQHRMFGTSIFGVGDWDVCLVLDSCRVDMLRDAWPGRETVTARWSRGSVTTEWLANTFHAGRRDTVADVGFVAATPHSETVFEDRAVVPRPSHPPVQFPRGNVVRPSAFDGYYEVWRSHASDAGAVEPSVMVDATLEAAERHDRVVSHWLQPHEPFIAPGAEYRGGSATEEKNVWRALDRGTVSHETVWAAYRANLAHALEHVQQFLDAFDGRVLITSDHGNAFGAWGVYGHPYGWPEPSVRRVPFFTVEATDRGTYDPDSVLESEPRDGGRGEQLRALGYR